MSTTQLPLRWNPPGKFVCGTSSSWIDFLMVPKTNLQSNGPSISSTMVLYLLACPSKNSTYCTVSITLNLLKSSWGHEGLASVTPSFDLLSRRLTLGHATEFPRQITLQKAKWLRSINHEIAKFRQDANLTLYYVIVDGFEFLPR